jgi:hypothetical protein
MSGTRIIKDFSKPVWDVDFAFAKGAANHSTCTITVKDKAGNTIGEPMPMFVWISDDVNGAGLPAVGPTNLAAISGGGTYLQELTANQSAIVLTNGAGQFKLDITDAVTKVYYVCAAPLAGESGFVCVSRIMAATDFT